MQLRNTNRLKFGNETTAQFDEKVAVPCRVAAQIILDNIREPGMWSLVLSCSFNDFVGVVFLRCKGDKAQQYTTISLYDERQIKIAGSMLFIVKRFPSRIWSTERTAQEGVRIGLFSKMHLWFHSIYNCSWIWSRQRSELNCLKSIWSILWLCCYWLICWIFKLATAQAFQATLTTLWSMEWGNPTGPNAMGTCDLPIGPATSTDSKRWRQRSLRKRKRKRNLENL